ncbi:hypothetical protein JCM17960_32230 [Magnetospira thiophila]
MAQVLVATNLMAAIYTGLIDFGLMAPDNQLPAQITATLPATEVEDLYRQGMVHFKERDYKAAFPLLQQAALNGHREAQYRVSAMYSLGWGAEEDDCLAIEWIDAAARQGHAAAQMELADAMGGPISGWGSLAHRPQQRLHWIYEAASHDNEDALEALENGHAYDDWFLTDAGIEEVKTSHSQWLAKNQTPEKIVRMPMIPIVTRLGTAVFGRYRGCNYMY